MDICQIGYDICEFDSLRGLGIDIIGRVHFDKFDKFDITVEINNIPALAQVMAWPQPGDKPLSEPMMVSLLTHHLASISYQNDWDIETVLYHDVFLIFNNLCIISEKHNHTEPELQWFV